MAKSSRQNRNSALSRIAAPRLVNVDWYKMLLSVSNMAMCCCAMAMRVSTSRQKGS
jgi:hypothetical protein